MVKSVPQNVFSKTQAGLAEFMQGIKPFDLSAIVSALYASFPDYVPYYFQGPDFMSDLSIHDLSYIRPDSLDISRFSVGYAYPGSREFRRAAGDTRPANEFVLTESEMQRAYEFCANTPQWRNTIAAFQACNKAYIQGVLDSGRLMYSEHFKDSVLHKIRREVTGRAFQGELMPIMAMTLADEDSLDRKAMARALCETFRAQTFTTLSAKGQKRTCPFSKVLQDIASEVYFMDNHGKIMRAGEKRPAALFEFIYQRVHEEREHHPHGFYTVDR